MAKELPYFRFTAQEWQNGDISLESYELKGLFIDICAYYWLKDCSIARTLLEKRFKNDIELIEQLIELEILGYNKKNDLIEISFLNEQFDVLSEARKRRQLAGSKGGKKKSSNAKAKPKQSSSYKDKDNNKININNTLLSELKSSDFENPQYYEIAISFYELFKKNLIENGAKTTTIEKAKGKWINHVRLLIERDKYTIEDLRKVFEFLQKDEFWKMNILSTAKLREQFDKLILKANGQAKEIKGNSKGATDAELAEVLYKHFGDGKE